jgi:hypothetical protein
MKGFKHNDVHQFSNYILWRPISKLLVFAALLLLLAACKKDIQVENLQMAPQQKATSKEEMQAKILQEIERQKFDAQLLSKAAKGGFEKNNFAKNSKIAATLNTRVLVNGSILGYNSPGYQQPYITAAGNLMVDAAELLRRFDYTVSYPTSTTLEATRNSVNSYGAQKIRITANSEVIDFWSFQSYTGKNYFPYPELCNKVNNTFFVPARMLAYYAGAARIDYDQETNSLQTYYYEELDYGLYFFGSQPDVNNANDINGCQKLIAGQPNTFFDPNKPTMIFVHGWKNGGVNSRWRQDFLLDFAGQYLNTHNNWLATGWNVAFFNWTQLADDDWGMPVETEKKIYDANNPNKMRWKKSDGNFSGRGNPNKSVAQLFLEEYQKMVQLQPSNTDNFMIGNSLGGNLELAMLRLAAINNTKLPTRVSLMDPYWDPNLGGNWWDYMTLPAGMGNTRAVAADAAKKLSDKGVGLEYQRSSLGGMLSHHKAVADIACFTNFYPEYTSDLDKKHTIPSLTYIWARYFANLNIANAPNVSLANVRSMMNTQNYWEQTGGQNSVSPSDDIYTKKIGGKP